MRCKHTRIESLAFDAAAIGPEIAPNAVAEAIKANIIFSESRILVQARGNSRGRLIFKDLVKLDG